MYLSIGPVVGVIAVYALLCHVAQHGVPHLLAQGSVLLAGMTALCAGLVRHFESVQQELPGTPVTVVLVSGGVTAIGAVVARNVVRSALREG